MGFVSAFKAFFISIGKIAGFFEDRQLINAGKAIEKGAQASDALESIKDVKKIKEDVADMSDSELDDELFNIDRERD